MRVDAARAAVLGLLLATAVAGVARDGAARDRAAREVAVQDRTAPPPTAVARVVPDTTRVGEPFLVGVAVRAAPGVRVDFPDTFPSDEGLEAVEDVSVREEESLRRATYRVVAWQPGSRSLPEVAVRWSVLEEEGDARGDGGRGGVLRVRPPDVVVASVLPAEAEAGDLELRQERPYLRIVRSPWGWIVGGLLLLGLLLWWWRRRRARRPSSAPGAAHPAERALRELRELRDDWVSGRLRGPDFYDGLETILRRYAGEARGWPSGRPLAGLADGDGDLRHALRRSRLVRFARLRAADEAAMEAVSAAAAWVGAGEPAAAGSEAAVGREATAAPEAAAGSEAASGKADR